MKVRSLARQWLPPALLERLRPLFRSTIHFSGDYANWEAASARSSGYDAALILERVKEAMLKVTRGQARYERDSVVFDEVQHSFPVLAGLLRAASESGNRLSVLDFGGSLGSSYFQCRNFLPELPQLSWGVIEQKHFVDCGRRLFQTEQLHFFHTISECVQQTAPNVALLSSVLQYVPDPYDVLDELMAAGIAYLMIDRTPFTDNETDRITIQHVPETIYKASYPCRLFGRHAFLEKFSGRYDVIAQFDGRDGRAIASGVDFVFGGMILHKA